MEQLSWRRKTKISAFSLTKVGDRADLAGYLLFRVFPHAAQEINDEVYWLLSELCEGL